MFDRLTNDGCSWDVTTDAGEQSECQASIDESQAPLIEKVSCLFSCIFWTSTSSYL